MHARIEAGHEECTTVGLQDMRITRQEGCRALGMHNRKDVGYEEYMTEGMQGLKNAQQDRGRT